MNTGQECNISFTGNTQFKTNKHTHTPKKNNHQSSDFADDFCLNHISFHLEPKSPCSSIADSAVSSERTRKVYVISDSLTGKFLFGRILPAYWCYRRGKKGTILFQHYKKINHVGKYSFLQ